MLSDAQSRQCASTQRNQCEEPNDQTVSIVQCVCNRNVLGCVDLGDDAVHQIDSECIESLACHQMMFLWLLFCLSCYPFGDGQQPRPILAWADVSKCHPEMVKIVGDRYASAGCWLPPDIGFDDLAVEPFGRSTSEQAIVTIRGGSEE